MVYHKFIFSGQSEYRIDRSFFNKCSLNLAIFLLTAAKKYIKVRTYQYPLIANNVYLKWTWHVHRMEHWSVLPRTRFYVILYYCTMLLIDKEFTLSLFLTTFDIQMGKGRKTFYIQNPIYFGTLFHHIYWLHLLGLSLQYISNLEWDHDIAYVLILRPWNSSNYRI